MAKKNIRKTSSRNRAIEVLAGLSASALTAVMSIPIFSAFIQNRLLKDWAEIDPLRDMSDLFEPPDFEKIRNEQGVTAAKAKLKGLNQQIDEYMSTQTSKSEALLARIESLEGKWRPMQVLGEMSWQQRIGTAGAALAVGGVTGFLVHLYRSKPSTIYQASSKAVEGDALQPDVLAGAEENSQGQFTKATELANDASLAKQR